MKNALILDFAKERSQEVQPFFKYDYNKNLNIIHSNNDQIPFISMKSNSSMELLTKTDNLREQDDDTLCFLELYTKTKQDREIDDDDYYSLLTKTFQNREQDDNDIVYYQ